MSTYNDVLSSREVRAKVYSNKCKARRERVSRRRAEKFDRVTSFLIPFSIGAFLMVSTVAVLV